MLGYIVSLTKHTGYRVPIIGLDSQESNNEMFADAKGVTRIYNSNKGRHCNGKTVKEIITG